MYMQDYVQEMIRIYAVFQMDRFPDNTEGVRGMPQDQE